MNTAGDIAKFFLFKAGQDEDLLTNLKLQKLLYYAQGYYLALNDGTRLFSDEIEAWTHGPVVASVYKKYKSNGAKPIAAPDDFDPGDFPPKIIEFLNKIYSALGQYSGWALRNFSHTEPPWNSVNIGEVIPITSLHDYFVTQISK